MYLKTYALYKMIWETCGEDKETLENVTVIELLPNVFHVGYKTYDPYEGMDFKVKISFKTANGKTVCHYDIWDSKFGDNGDFDIIL